MSKFSGRFIPNNLADPMAMSVYPRNHNISVFQNTEPPKNPIEVLKQNNITLENSIHLHAKLSATTSFFINPKHINNIAILIFSNGFQILAQVAF